MDLFYKNNFKKILHKKKYLFDNKIYPNKIFNFTFVPTINYPAKKYLQLRNQNFILQNTRSKKKNTA